MPNQENVINRDTSVTYNDSPINLLMILLPNRELMQANSFTQADNSFGK